MNEAFIRERITQLRLIAGKSEREMSLDLGHSGSYINSITSGRISPSLKEFLYICEYLHVTPEAFFQADLPVPAELSADKTKLIQWILSLDDKDVTVLLNSIRKLAEKS